MGTAFDAPVHESLMTILSPHTEVRRVSPIAGLARTTALCAIALLGGCESGWDLRVTVSYDAAAWMDGERELLVATKMRSSASGAAYFGKHQIWMTPTAPPLRYDDGAAVGCPAPMMNVMAWLSERVPTAAGQSPLMVEPQPGDLFAETGWVASPRCTSGYDPLVLTLALAPVR
jgi:hypothetical protein